MPTPPSPNELALSSGQFQTSSHRNAAKDSLRMLELLNERVPFVAKITALDSDVDNQFLGDVYGGTQGLSIDSGTLVYSQIDIFNCDPSIRFAVNDLVFVNVIRGTAWTVPNASADSNGEFIYQIRTVVAQNRDGYSMDRACPLIPNA